MPAPIDIYRTAAVMIRRHGDDAGVEAAMRADRLLAAGDLDGAAVWRRVLAAIEELQRKGKGGQTVH